jgi:hypothetical protein
MYDFRVEYRDGIACSLYRLESAPKGENYPKSNTAARKALELDATLAPPHAVLGGNEMEYDWDFAGGEAEYKKAFELGPQRCHGPPVVRVRYWLYWWQREGSPC